ncbi:MAG: metal-dependent hydrolase [Shimia sp.]|nr:metal-dependent hydrolase [Shimia sp.]
MKTQVTFPNGSCTETSSVVRVEPYKDAFAIICEITPFHPVSHTWPDQPADRGALILANGTSIPLLDCVTAAALDGEEHLFVGTDIPRAGEGEVWQFHAAHIVADASALKVGDEVILQVDAGHRSALNAGHTGCHLASLALNKALAGCWTKEFRRDGLGHPNFDQVALQTSHLEANRSFDSYRIGRSLRKKGFDVAAFTALQENLAEDMQTTLAGWLAEPSNVLITPAAGSLMERRDWVCTLSGQEVRIPCGGTHLDSLSRIESIAVEISFDPEGAAFDMVSTTTQRP